jgi:GDPmannose 4,6-dehydratase
MSSPLAKNIRCERFCRSGLRVAGLLTGRITWSPDERFFRPTEIYALRGDYTKAARVLGWRPTVSFEELVGMMVANDLQLVQKKHGK